MIKEFEINDILNAVNSISKIERKKGKITDTENDSNNIEEYIPSVIIESFPITCQ